MNVTGPSGAHSAGGLEHDAGLTPAQAEVASATAVRGGGTTVPASVQKEALAYDQAHHKNRNIPDLSYGPTFIDGHKNTDGSYTVNVGSSPTSIMGPRPGQKPFDIVSYHVDAHGKVSVEQPTTSTPHWGDPGFVLDALKKHDNKGATSKALAAAEGLYTGGMGFPRLTDKPDATAVARFKNLLSALSSAGKLDDLKTAVDAEEKREHDSITHGSTRPIPDWYGPAEIMGALMNKYATTTQKHEYNKGK
jgi:hypothetical protein